MKNNVENTISYPSTIENIDFSVYEWFNNFLSPSVQTNSGIKKVPIIFSSPERGFFVKEYEHLRDNFGTLIYPIISIYRNGSIKKPKIHRGNMGVNIWPNPDYKQGSIVINRKIQQDKTKDRANALSNKKFNQLNFPFKNNKTIFESIIIPQPVNIEIPYKITIVSEYRQQINEILSSFLNRVGNINSFYLERNGHRYEAFIEENIAKDFDSNLELKERKFEISISINVVGYIIGEENNQRTPNITKRENAVDVVLKEQLYSEIPKPKEKKILVTETPSTIENIDYSIFNWINDKINIKLTSQQETKKVPVIFSSPERSFYAKEYEHLRDNFGTLIYPIISIERENEIERPNEHHGNMGVNIWPNSDFKRASIKIHEKIQQDKSKDRANVTSLKSVNQLNFPGKNNRIVFEQWFIPQPVNVEISYKIKIVCQYRQHENQIISSIISRLGNINSFYLERNGHRYEAFIDENIKLDEKSNNYELKERLFESYITIKVIGFLIGEQNNQRTPNIVKRETSPDIVIKEHIITNEKIQ